MRHLTATIALLALATTSQAEEFRWAGQTDPQTMDPHAVSSAPVLGFLNNVYEGLVRRDADMQIEPALATSWETIGDGEGWRFVLREGVTFQDGAAFTADDVVFSYERASSEQSDVASWFAPVSKVEKVDDYTVDIFTSAPNPIFPDSIANWMMIDADWAQANDTQRPDKEQGNYATLNANGTGAFRVTDRQPGLQTVLEPFENWWGEVEHNITKATFSPIQNPATAVAALSSGDVDFINPVPIQDAARLEATVMACKVHQGHRGAHRSCWAFGQDQADDAEIRRRTRASPTRSADARVRKAVAQAINVDAILQTIMRGAMPNPSSQLVSPRHARLF